MAILNPTVPTTPDQGGTQDVTGITNNGHGSTLTSIGAVDIESQPPKNVSIARSARWSAFESGGGFSSLTLQFNWSANGSTSAEVLVGGSAGGSVQFVVQYSLDGGANWITQVNKARSSSVSGEGSDSDSINESGSETIILSPSQNISLVQVRDRMDAQANASAPNVTGAEASGGAGITTTVSEIKLIGVRAARHIVFGMGPG